MNRTTRPTAVTSATRTAAVAAARRPGSVIAAVAASMLIIGLFPAATQAVPDAGDPVKPRFSSADNNCPLQRVGTQFVRCDNLTGAGHLAPAWVPQL